LDPAYKKGSPSSINFHPSVYGTPLGFLDFDDEAGVAIVLDTSNASVAALENFIVEHCAPNVFLNWERFSREY